ncbi:RNase H domain-containing protein [Trichonephila clavipes]|uniref:RNase H domain-containing protein n=1 Tax=Trichonephila clavipes TaxID=2585209 RepID=A0A8X6RLE4_TRICX|nr:RNase H domain-containing protein [Trichonephila clavipes]
MCGLSLINNIQDQTFSESWILTDNRPSIQHLSNWPSIGDSTSRGILHLFLQLSDRHPIHLQWVPSHVGLPGNEVGHIILTSIEIYSRVKELICVEPGLCILYTHGTFKDTLDPPYHSRVSDLIRGHSRDFRLVT